jgi:hypothetical protein
MKIASFLLFALVSVGCTDVGFTHTAAMCNDSTSYNLAFQHTNMSPAQENEMATRQEARLVQLCKDHGGIFFRRPRRHITDF